MNRFLSTAARASTSLPTPPVVVPSRTAAYKNSLKELRKSYAAEEAARVEGKRVADEADAIVRKQLRGKREIFKAERRAEGRKKVELLGNIARAAREGRRKERAAIRQVWTNEINKGKVR